MGFFSQPFTNQRMQWKGEGISLTPHYHFHLLHRHLRHQPGNYCREFTSTHRQQLDSNQESLVSECKLQTNKLHTLKFKSIQLRALIIYNKSNFIDVSHILTNCKNTILNIQNKESLGAAAVSKIQRIYNLDAAGTTWPAKQLLTHSSKILQESL